MVEELFWKIDQLNKNQTVFETPIYLVVVTPPGWRTLAREKTDRNLGEYSVVNKLYGTVESSAQNLPLAVTTATALQEAYDELVVKQVVGEDNGKVTSIFRKDRPE